MTMRLLLTLEKRQPFGGNRYVLVVHDATQTDLDRYLRAGDEDSEEVLRIPSASLHVDALPGVAHVRAGRILNVREI